MVSSYFDPATKLIYAIGAVVGLIGGVAAGKPPAIAGKHGTIRRKGVTAMFPGFPVFPATEASIAQEAVRRPRRRRA